MTLAAAFCVVLVVALVATCVSAFFEGPTHPDDWKSKNF